MASDMQKQFIREIGPIIREEAVARGYQVASPIIAQATVESFKGAGLSTLASKYHNYFGMKAGSKWTGPTVNLKTGEEYQPGVITQIRDNFRVYPDLLSGVCGYFSFISAQRYAALKTARTPEEYLVRIKAAGYATSSTYVQTNLKRIQLYNLRDYDKGFGYTVEPRNPYARPYGLVKPGMRGEPVQWVQWELNQQGFSLKVDGIYGPKTEDAVRTFQSRSHLACDAIVGPRTVAALID
jgi:flagellum-specific peptidoglycan hydrolase FlgJ